MFLITENCVQEQDGYAEYYLLPDDILFLAKNTQARITLLTSLGTNKILVDSTEKPGKKNIVLRDFINCSSSLHSRL